MAESHLRQGALAHLHLDARALLDRGDGELTLCDRGFRGQLALRGDAAGKRFVDGVRKVLGVAPPTEAHAVAASRRGVSVLWLGPDEWLAVLPDGREGKARSDLETALAGEHCLVSDVSASRVIIGLEGAGAREVLMKGCALDLHPRVFGPGRCAQSSLARCHLLLHQLDERPAFDLYVHRSFAEYAWRWLEDAGREFGLRVSASTA